MELDIRHRMVVPGFADGPPAATGFVHYDAVRRRLWIAGQRCHHGATGALLAAAAGTGLLAARLKPRGLVALIATGGLLMAHDWHDRSIWFERGWGDQP